MLRSVKWSVLIGCPVVDVTWFVSWYSALIHLLILLHSEYATRPHHSLGESATSLLNII